MKILITGATGFIGRRLTNRLLDEGHEIYAIVRPQSIEKAKSIFHEKKILIENGEVLFSALKKNNNTHQI